MGDFFSKYSDRHSHCLQKIPCDCSSERRRRKTCSVRTIELTTRVYYRFNKVISTKHSIFLLSSRYRYLKMTIISIHFTSRLHTFPFIYIYYHSFLAVYSFLFARVSKLISEEKKTCEALR